MSETRQRLLAENDELRSRITAMEARIAKVRAERDPRDLDIAKEFQHRADSVVALFGDRVPAPVLGEGSLQYRRKILQRLAEKYSPVMGQSRLDGIDHAGLDLIEGQIFADAREAARHIEGGARPGILVERVEPDAAGRRIVKSYGDPMAWMQHFVRGGQRCRIRDTLI
jgi:hypothetical protein